MASASQALVATLLCPYLNGTSGCLVASAPTPVAVQPRMPGAACRAEGERRLVGALVHQGRIEEAEAKARDGFALCQEAGLQVLPLPVHL